MKFVEFRERILSDLQGEPGGLTWKELKKRNNLPYDRPCPEWTRSMEEESGIVRRRRKGRELLWEIDTEAQ